MSENFFSFKGSVLPVVKGGTGNKILLLFHGFGQDNTVFADLIRPHGYGYAVYAFDLFFHGKSEWSYGEKPLLVTVIPGEQDKVITLEKMRNFLNRIKGHQVILEKKGHNGLISVLASKSLLLIQD